jgi:hypothetical protein
MAKKAELLEVSYKPAQGGVISETRTRMKRGGQGGGPDYDHETEQAVHPTLEHAQKHLSKVFGKTFGGHEEPAAEGKEAAE